MADDASNAQLEQLQAILNEFYTTKDSRRQQEIDAMLAEFKSQPTSWRHAMHFLMSAEQLQAAQSGQYVLFFGVLVFEEFVRRYWTEADEGSKAEMRSFVMQVPNVKHIKHPNQLVTSFAMFVEHSPRKCAATACIASMSALTSAPTARRCNVAAALLPGGQYASRIYIHQASQGQRRHRETGVASAIPRLHDDSTAGSDPWA